MKDDVKPVAFGIRREELMQWKESVKRGEIAYLTHYWYEPRFPQFHTVTKVGCSDLERLAAWCIKYDLPPHYIHHRFAYPHFDLIGPKQKEILQSEQQWAQLERFGML